MSAAIEISNLTYCYRTDWTRSLRQAVKGLTITINDGEFFGFLGHNGAGKTTTIKCLLDLVRPTSGEIKIFGRDSRDPAARLSVGYLPEQPYFYDHLTVSETMELYGTLRGLSGPGLKSEIERCLSVLNIIDRRNSRIRTLSKGLMQRVAMAQTILGDPKLLVLDEPFSGLDPIGRREFREILRAEQSAGKTIFICSHILSDIEFLCNRASIMVKGELKGIYEMDTLAKQSDSAVEIVFSVSGAFEMIIKTATEHSITKDIVRAKYDNLATAQTALKELIASNAKILAFEPVHSHLEDIFVDLVKGAK